MKKSLFFILSIISIQVCAQSYNSIEAVEYDPNNNRFLVSNGSSIISRASDGTLSFFGTNASANYGMEVMGNTLFAIKNSQVRGYDLDTEEEVMSITISGAGFLNGMANNGSTLLWVSDFGSSKIYEIDVSDLDNPSFTTVINNTGTTPNGLVYDADNDRILMANWLANAPIISIDPSTYEMTTLLNTGLGSIDGIDNNGEGEFFISSWSPTRITKYNNDFSSSEIITAPGLSNPADISYAIEIDSLAIPNSGNNTVTFVSFGSVDVEEFSANDFELQIYPNPVTEASAVQFNLEQVSNVKLNIYDSNGRLVESLIDEKLLAGNHKVLLTGIQIPTGHFIISMEVDGQLEHIPFIKK